MRSRFRKNREENEKTSRNRIIACVVITLVFAAAFVVRLADWQLINGEKYYDIATRSTSYTVETEAKRGEILDCSGKGLVVNKTCYRIVLDKLYVNADTLDSTVLKLADILKQTGDKRTDSLPIEIKNGAFVFSGNSDEVGTLLSEDYLNLPDGTSAQTCVEKLCERYGTADGYSDSELLIILSVRYNMELCGYSNTNPYCFAENISRNTVTAVSENMQGISGVDVETYTTREVPDADIAPHILGALGALTQEELEAKTGEGKSYALNDSIGKFGIELAYEDILKGTAGTKIVQKNSDGTVVGVVKTTDAQPGNTIYLTLDYDLQSTAVKSLQENVKAAKALGEQNSKAYGASGYGEDCDSGAVVMLSVKDFSVLAAASYPTYDLNKYSEYDDYYVRLSQDENAPLYNRAFVGSFACGSVYKPMVACAALEEKVIDSDTLINCTQAYDYYPTDIVNCMHYHGELSVTGAICKSCNYFFAETGRRLGIDNMYLYSERFGLGEYTGVEIEESKGTLAGRDSTTWLEGNTVSAAIGQSDNAFTPLQLATYAATIANDGTRLKTHIVRKITDYTRSDTIEENSPDNPTVVTTCGISQENLDTVQNAMLEVTQNPSGTAYYMFGDYKVKIAAKTGTAENAGSDHTTFICYAPYDEPEVAIAVVIENGANGRYSMQVAKDLLDAYFGG